MLDVPSWSDLQTEFSQYAVEHADLRATWTWIYTHDDLWAKRAPHGEWALSGGSPSAQHLFREITRRTARLIPGDPPGGEPWRRWLDLLRAEGYARKVEPKRISVRQFKAIVESGESAPLPPGFGSEHIENLFKSSAEFCRVCSLAESPVDALPPHPRGVGKQPASGFPDHPPSGADSVQSDREAKTDANEMTSTGVLFGSSRQVMIVRAVGTPEEQRWDTQMGGDFDRKALFQASDKVATGDEIHCEIFDRPRIVLRIKPVIASGEVVYWEAAIAPRPERSRSEVGLSRKQTPIGENDSRAGGHARKGDVTLLQDPGGTFKDSVSYDHACAYLGISRRQVQRLVSEKQSLKAIGGGHNKQITVVSLLAYLPARKTT